MALAASAWVGPQASAPLVQTATANRAPVVAATGSSSTPASKGSRAALAITAAAALIAPSKSRRKASVAMKAETAVLEKQPEVKDPLEQENVKLLEEFAEQVEEINALEEVMEQLDNDGLRAKTLELKKQIKENGGFTRAIVNDAFAVLREAVWRVLELWYFDVQLLGGLVLHSERLAEMKTGEGKTIVALLPTFLAALEEKGGNYVVTPNDYLARRDAENVGQVLRFLGVTVGLVQNTMEVEERRKAYKADVVYLTNAELGFDYLRDNLAVYEKQMCQFKNFHFCLVDEADSILIDEARTPLIISESVAAVPRQFDAAKEVSAAMQKDLHYTVDEKNMNLVMTDLGERVAQELLGVDNLWEPEEAWVLYVLNALKAKELFQQGKHYIMRDGKIAIVDTFTGRVLDGRRWADGMHQAIETKEGINVSVRSQVSAQITYQSLFRLFPRLCAMTGTALTEAPEFDEIYGLRGTAIPTARPNVRRDYPDVVYKTDEAKLKAIVEEITLQMNKNGRPILVGTSNVKMSEAIVERLRENGVEPQLLNARPESVSRENETIAQAGRLGMVTVSTNMAGRGTDIILGGNHSQMASLNLRARLAELLLPTEEMGKVPAVNENFYPCPTHKDLNDALNAAAAAVAESEVGQESKTFLLVEELVASIAGEAPFEDGPSQQVLLTLREKFNELKSLYKDALAAEKDKVIKAGGLYVLGTTRHESRRIDNQLRGRAGRQGDPGTTRFFVSLEDDVFRIFGGNRIKDMMERFRLGDDVPLQSNMVNDTLDRVQSAVEEFFKKSRTTLFDFDKVISKQRELTYKNRREYLASDDARVIELVKAWGEDAVKIHIEQVWPELDKEKNKDNKAEPKTLEEKKKEFTDYFGLDMPDVNESTPAAEVESKFMSLVKKGIEEKITSYEDFRPGFSVEAARIATVVTIDDEWKALLQKMEALKQTCGLAAYKGTEPLKEYQLQGFKMYQKAENKYKARSVSRWLRSKPKKDQKPDEQKTD